MSAARPPPLPTTSTRVIYCGGRALRKGEVYSPCKRPHPSSAAAPARLKVSNSTVRPEGEIQVEWEIEGKMDKEDFIGLYESSHMDCGAYDASLQCKGMAKGMTIFIAPMREGNYVLRLVRELRGGGALTELASAVVCVASSETRKGDSPTTVLDVPMAAIWQATPKLPDVPASHPLRLTRSTRGTTLKSAEPASSPPSRFANTLQKQCALGRLHSLRANDSN
jgi:hypothetical protein